MASPAPLLYESAASTEVVASRTPTGLRTSTARCQTTSHAPDSVPALPIPTLVLDLSFQDQIPRPNDDPELVPIHALLWAIHSRVVRVILAAQNQNQNPQDRTHRLPTPPPDELNEGEWYTCSVVQMQLPCAAAFPAFVWAIHHSGLPDSIRGPVALDRSPVVTGSPFDDRRGSTFSASTSASHRSSTYASRSYSSTTTTDDAPAEEARVVQALLARAEIIQGVWQTLRTLEWEDLDLWEQVCRAWEEVVVSLEEIEMRKPAQARRASTRS